MIEVFDTAAARIALGRRKLGCPGCGQPLRPWGRARERTVRDLGGALVTVRPDRLRAWTRTDELAGALKHLAAGALVLGRRTGWSTPAGGRGSTCSPAAG